MEQKKEKVLGFDVDLITLKDAVMMLSEKIKNKQGVHVVTINPEIIESAKKNNKLKEIIEQAQLVVPDGSGIKLALMFKGIKQERIPGIDLAYALLEEANHSNFSAALVGAKPDVVEKAVTTIQNKLNNINICYKQDGYFDSEKENIIINDIYNLQPDIILVALGSPKQEFFIQKCKEKYPNAVYIGVGGSFDVWAGVVERAPYFFRFIGCEWIYRTYKQPERLKRIYKTLPLFAVKAIIEAVEFRFLRKGDNNGKQT
ncbi:MAG: WecB/TagA/CpsF family glycosyltransferase [Candidatus Avigastranaerophilus sp.]